MAYTTSLEGKHTINDVIILLQMVPEIKLSFEPIWQINSVYLKLIDGATGSYIPQATTCKSIKVQGQTDS